MRRQPKICAPIVEPVAVNVINQFTWFGTQNETGEINFAAANRRVKLESAIPAVDTPCVCANALRVYSVDDKMMACGVWYNRNLGIEIGSGDHAAALAAAASSTGGRWGSIARRVAAVGFQSLPSQP